MSVSDVDLSRAVSHALRHAPWLYELELDDEGWTPLAELVTALSERGGAWAGVDEACRATDGPALREAAARGRPGSASGRGTATRSRVVSVWTPA
jgi:hypothetical protein